MPCLTYLSENGVLFSKSDIYAICYRIITFVHKYQETTSGLLNWNAKICINLRFYNPSMDSADRPSHKDLKNNFPS